MLQVTGDSSQGPISPPHEWQSAPTFFKILHFLAANFLHISVCLQTSNLSRSYYWSCSPRVSESMPQRTVGDTLSSAIISKTLPFPLKPQTLHEVANLL